MLKKLFLLILFVIFSFSVFAKNYVLCSKGHKNPTTAKFCIVCGEKLRKKTPQNKKDFVMFCPVCKTIYKNKNMKFCIKDGSRLVKKYIKSSIKHPIHKKHLYRPKKKLEKKYIIKNKQRKKIVKKTIKKPKKKTKILQKKVFKNKPNKIIVKKENKIVELAEKYYKEKNYFLALNEYKKVLNKTPKDIDTMYNIGVINYYLKNYSESNYYFDKILKISPKDLDTLFYNSMCLYKLSLYIECKNNLSKIILLTSDNKTSQYYKKAIWLLKKLNK